MPWSLPSRVFGKTFSNTLGGKSARQEDGTPYTLLRPEYSFAELAFGPTHPRLMFSPRIAPSVFGVGPLEVIPGADMLALTDPDDDVGDGISGRANRVWDAAPLDQFATHCAKADQNGDRSASRSAMRPPAASRLEIGR